MTTLASVFEISSPPSPMPFAADEPRSVGHWQLQAVLWRGRWTTVYRATPGELDRDCPGDYAVKIARVSGDELASRILKTEATVGSSVFHPHLVPVLAWQTDLPRPYLVLPFLSGSSLRRQLESGCGLRPRLVIWWLRQTAEAVTALHEAGWLHGDIKPENVMVSPSGHATLIDLGFVRPFDSAEGRKELMGTPAYAAPERLSRQPRVLPQSDVYSLGVMAYEMFTGSRPSPAVIAAPQNLSAALRRVRPDCPSKVADWIGAMLASSPEDRPLPHDCIEQCLRWELDGLVHRLGQTPPPRETT